MAAASLTITANGKHVRTYGGNRTDVRREMIYYKNITVEKFNEIHPSHQISSLDQLDIYAKFNK